MDKLQYFKKQDTNRFYVRRSAFGFWAASFDIVKLMVEQPQEQMSQNGRNNILKIAYILWFLFLKDKDLKLGRFSIKTSQNGLKVWGGMVAEQQNGWLAWRLIGWDLANKHDS